MRTRKKKFSFIKLLIGLGVTTLGGLLMLPYILDFEAYRSSLSQAMGHATGTNVEIKGEITGSFVPYPKIIAKDVTITGHKEEGKKAGYSMVKVVEANVNILDLLEGKTRVNAVTLIEPSLDWKSLHHFYKVWTQEAKKEGDTQSAAEIKSIIISNGTIAANSTHTLKAIHAVNTTIAMPSFGSSAFSLKGDFIVDEDKFSYDTNLEPGKKGDNSSTWNFFGDGFSLTFEGDMAQEENGKIDLEGKLTGRGEDAAFLIRRYMHNENIKYKAPEQGQASARPIEFQSTFLYTKDKLNVENIQINSDIIQGKGSIRSVMEREVPEVDISLVFDKIDTNFFVQKNAKKSLEGGDVTAEDFIEESKRSEGAYEGISAMVSNVGENLNMLCDVSIKQMDYRNNSLKNIVLNADIFNGDLFIHQLSANLPGTSVVEVTGAVKHNVIRPKFLGEVLISGEDLRSVLDWLGADVAGIPETLLKKYKASGDIMFLPQKISVKGADFSVDNIQGSGNIIVRQGIETSKITSIIKLNNVDFDQYHFSAPIADFIKKYYYGEPSNPYTRNFSWLRSRTGHFSTELTLDQSKFNDIVIDHLAATFTLDPGTLRMKDFVFNSEPLKFSSDVKVDITGLRPVVDFSILGDKIDTAAFGYKAAERRKDQPLEWSKEPFNFLGLGRFDGSMDIKLKDFKHKDIVLKKLDFVANLKDGLMEFKKVNAFVGEKGKLTATGSMFMEGDPILSVSFALNNMMLQDVLGVFSDFDAFSGYLSVSGSAIARGKSMLDWVKTMKSNVTVALRGVEITKFGLHDFIDESATVTTAAQLDKLAKRIVVTGKTQLLSVDGVFSIAGGLLDFTQFDVLTSRARGVVGGKVDLVNWMINVVGRFSYYPLKETNPVMLGYSAVGAIYKPEKKLDVTDFMKYKGIQAMPEAQPDDPRLRRLR